MPLWRFSDPAGLGGADAGRFSGGPRSAADPLHAARVCFISRRPLYLLVVVPRFPIFKKFLTNRERVSCS
jgi:hypothetical protein